MTILTTSAAAAGRGEPFQYVKAVTPTLVAGRPQSLAYLTGSPGAIAAPAGGLSGEALSQSGGPLAGYLQFKDGVGAVRNEILKFTVQSSGSAGMLLLMDRLWHNSGINVTATTPQTINSLAFPPRDENEAVNGRGVGLALEVVTATGAGAPVHTITYTDADGTSGLSAVRADAYTATAAIGAFHRFSLANDKGAQSIQTYQASATMTSGAVSLVAYRTLAEVPLKSATEVGAIDWLLSGATRSIANGACPFLVFVSTATTASALQGAYQYTQG